MGSNAKRRREAKEARRDSGESGREAAGDSAGPAASAGNRGREWAARIALLALAALAALLAWGGVLGAPYVWDDHSIFHHPAYLRQGWSLGAILHPILGNPETLWRPLGMLALGGWIDVSSRHEEARAAGLAAWGLFAGASALWARSELRRAGFGGALGAGLAALAGALIAAHPAAGLAGAWVSGNFHLGSAFALLCGMALAGRLLEGGPRRLLGLEIHPEAMAGISLGAALLIAALFSESGAAGAALLAGWLGLRGAGRRAWGAFAAAGLSALGLWLGLRSEFIGSAWPSGGSFSGLDGVLDAGMAAKALLLPVPAGYPGAVLDGGAALLGWGALALLLAAGWAMGGKGRPALWALAAAGGYLALDGVAGRIAAPEGLAFVGASELALAAPMAALGIAALLGEALARSIRSEKGGPGGFRAAALSALALSAAAALLLGSESREVAKAWSGDVSLWAAAAEASPDSGLARGNRIVSLAKAGRASAALEEGGRYWESASLKGELSRHELAAMASYAGLLIAGGKEELALSRMVLLLPKSAKEPLVALNLAHAALRMGNPLEAKAAAEFALSHRGKAWRGSLLAGELELARAKALARLGAEKESQEALARAKEAFADVRSRSPAIGGD